MNAPTAALLLIIAASAATRAPAPLSRPMTRELHRSSRIIKPTGRASVSAPATYN